MKRFFCSLEHLGSLHVTTVQEDGGRRRNLDGKEGRMEIESKHLIHYQTVDEFRMSLPHLKKCVAFSKRKFFHVSICPNINISIQVLTQSKGPLIQLY